MISLKAEYDGVTYPIERYQFYSMREAIKLYRTKHGLVNKKLNWLRWWV